MHYMSISWKTQLEVLILDCLNIVILSATSFAVLFLLTKLIGNRQMSQLSLFDYIIGISIGSIAAEMATSLEKDFLHPIIAMAIYALFSVLIGLITRKSIRSRKFFESSPLILIDNGKLYYDSFKKSKMDINEFLMQCRINGYFNIADIHTAVLEANGKVSFIPKSVLRPATSEDLGISPEQAELVSNVVTDGNIIEQNLKLIGRDINWLKNEIKSQNAGPLEDIFLATCDMNGNLSIYHKHTRNNKNNKLEF